MDYNSNSSNKIKRTAHRTREDPNTTTTIITEWDSGDSDGAGYVYKKKATNYSRSPKRKASPPKAKSRSPHKCYCHVSKIPADDDDELTATDEDSNKSDEDDEDEEGSYYSSNPTTKSRSRTCTGKCLDSERKEERKKKKTAGKNIRRRRTPYIEEYPDDSRQPKVVPKEHKMPRRQSTSDSNVKRVLERERRPSSSSSGSRGRSPTGKRAAALPHQQRVKTSPKRAAHRKHQLEPSPGPPGPQQGEPLLAAHFAKERSAMADKEFPVEPDYSPHLELDESSGPSPPRHVHHGVDSVVTPIVTRSSAWTEEPQEYSSSRPANPGIRVPRTRSPAPVVDLQHDSDGESDHRAFSEEEVFDDRRRPQAQRPKAKPTKSRQASRERHQIELQMERERYEAKLQREREQYQAQLKELERIAREQLHQDKLKREMERERERKRERELERERKRELERERERERERESRSRSLPRRRTMPASNNYSPHYMDQSGDLADPATEIWRGRAEDWESPYPSDQEDNYSDGAGYRGYLGQDSQAHHPHLPQHEPRMLLPPTTGCARAGTPSSLPVPPQGARNQFGFAPASTGRGRRCSASESQSRRAEYFSPSGAAVAPRQGTGPRRTGTCPSVMDHHSTYGRRANDLFLLEGPAESGFAEEEAEEDFGEGELERQGGWLVRVTGPQTVSPLAVTRRGMRGRVGDGDDFMSPKPVSPDRFHFDAWGRSRTEFGI
ncbi:hypothetical protein QBC42DRAFT_176460 [Cladorrhinum samala]|uniref:Uncharacterized protein n=1 Tax=Cladorrhinum samala TaxID=585594 RepID=A0AAV9HN96_9PEZI|nr:hypothetical protein QBC42DRAFT_176460 [Cladorrhinum samala]